MKQNAAILVVDDEEDIRRLLAGALARAGYRVSIAEDPWQALAALRAMPYDLVITDLKMPGMDGLELLRRIGTLYPQIKGIVLTSYASIESAVEATKLGADNYVAKPMAIEELLRVVGDSLERGRSLRSAPAPSQHVSLLTALTSLLAQPSPELEPLAQASVVVIASALAARVSLSLLDGETGREIVHAETPGPLGRGTDHLRTREHHTLDARLTAGLGLGYRGSLRLSRSRGTPSFSPNEAQLLQLAAHQVSLGLGHCLTSRSLAMARCELQDLSLQTIQALVRAAEMRDRYTAGHSARVSRYAVALARSLGLPRREVETLRVAALLHDVGKIGISDLLLNKAGPLTPAERTRIQEHPALGCQIVGGVHSLAASLPLIRHHQERYDGLGYPDQLAGERIPYGARLLAVADSFEAITATRAYRQGRCPAAALRILQAGAGEQWDAELVAQWHRIVARVLGPSG